MSQKHTITPLHSAPRSHMVYTIAVIGFIYAMHMVIPMYSHSSFLSLFTDAKTLGLIYMAGAGLTIIGYLVAPSIIRYLGNYKTAMLLICIQIAIFYGLIASTSSQTIFLLFIAQSAVIALVGLTLDIFLEVYTDGHYIGTVRGLYTATLNASWVIAPFIGSVLIGTGDNYRNTYVAGLAMLFPLLYLIYRNFSKFEDPNYKHISTWRVVKHIALNRDWKRLFFANTILQTFYAWMVVYSPIYLHKVIGFNWEQIGIIIVIMLLPFPFIQYPLGRLADRKYGEKEIMTAGFAIMGISTIVLALITSTNMWIWALALFCTRIGAASAEIMLETYFFKKVPSKDTTALGLFRITRPISYLLAPLISIVGLTFTTYDNLFAVIGIITLLGLYPAMTIRDTK